jgi:hypothetical protein
VPRSSLPRRAPLVAARAADNNRDNNNVNTTNDKENDSVPAKAAAAEERVGDEQHTRCSSQTCTWP